jgi:hypothetical protein
MTYCIQKLEKQMFCVIFLLPIARSPAWTSPVNSESMAAEVSKIQTKKPYTFELNDNDLVWNYHIQFVFLIQSSAVYC